MSVATLSLFRFSSPMSRIWVIGQMALARPRRLWSGARFVKLCGSGTGEGFTPRPNWSVWAIFAVWPDLEKARDHIANHRVISRWRTRAAESWTVFLSPFSARGAWAGVNPLTDTTDPQAHNGPIAALTRATVKPRHAPAFWARVPDISARIGADRNVLFKIGIGEVPLLHQVTFSIWPDAARMAEFARHMGPHAAAMKAARDNGWFAEEFYARFHVLGTQGQWSGTDPLAGARDTERHAA
ncbi:spheroidene monooxygenase [Rhodobacter sp. M37P]|uniref:Spheroidene monooxygenase n=1 Tax=Rhodobacter calidifons TaxID=2715277 RepID=A0ABX0G7W4_9RHOB|nr:spheroidene monooxygenase [Rhodobacter calidifons]